MSARVLAVVALVGLFACGGEDDDGKSSSSSSGTSSSNGSSSSCSSESTSSQAYLCIGDRCKCTSSKENEYPYTKEQAEKACSSGTSTGNCPPNGG